MTAALRLQSLCIALAALLLPAAAAAQDTSAYRAGVVTNDLNPIPMKLRCRINGAWTDCPTPAPGGDASASNQAKQIDAEQALGNKIDALAAKIDTLNTNVTSPVPTGNAKIGSFLGLCQADTASPQSLLTNGSQSYLSCTARNELRTSLSSQGYLIDALYASGDGNGAKSGLSTSSQNEVWNGATWDLQRGNSSGTFVQGSTPNGAAPVGGGLRLACKVDTAAQTTSVANGLTDDCRLTPNGEFRVALGANGYLVGTRYGNADYVPPQTGLVVWSMPNTWNGGGYDRATKPNAVVRITSSAASTNVTTLKAAASADVHAISAYNTTSSLRFLKLYARNTAPTIGTSVPLLTLALPPGATNVTYPNGGLYCINGCYLALTAGAADSDATALAAGDIVALNVAFD